MLRIRNDVPGRATPAVHNAMVRYSEVDRDGTVFAVLDPPANQSATDIVTYVSTTASLENLSEIAAIGLPDEAPQQPAHAPRFLIDLKTILLHAGER